MGRIIEELIVRYKTDTSDLTTGVKRAKDDMSSLSQEAKQATSTFKELTGSGHQTGSALQQDFNQASSATQRFGEAASSAFSRVKTEAGSVRQSISGFTSGIGNAAGSFLGGIGSMIGGLVNFGSKIGMTVVGLQGLYQGALGLGKIFLGSNASMEQTSVAFKQLLGSSSAATAELKDLQQFAASTPFEFPALADATQKLLAFQYPLKETRPLLTAIGDALSALGSNTPATLDQVVHVFGQMHSTTHLMTGDLMQLTSVGINGFQILADQMHKPVSVIRDMVSKGLIPANDGIEMLRKGMEKTFGGGMQAQSQTFNGLLSTFTDNIGQAWRTFTGPLFEEAKKGLQKLGDLVSSKAFQDFATTMGKDVAGAFGKVGEVLKPVGPMIQDLQHFFKGFDIGPLAGSFGNLKSAVSNLFAPLQVLKGAFGSDLWKTVDNAIRGFISGGAKALTGVFNGIGDTIRYLTPMFQQIAGIVGGVFSDHFKTASGIVKELGSWWQSTLIPAFEKARPGFEHLADAVTNTLVPGLFKLWAIGHSIYDKVAVPLAHAFENAAPVIVRFAGVISDGLGGAFEFLMPYVLQAGQALADFAGAIADHVEPIVSGWFGQMNSGLNDFQQNWQYIWPTLSATLSGVWDGIVGTVQAGWSLVSGIVLIGMDLLAGNWGQLWDDMANMFAGFWNGLITSMAGPLKLIGVNAEDLKITVAGKINGMKDQTSKSASDMSRNVTGSAYTMKTNVNSYFDDMLKHGTSQSQALDDKATSIMKGMGLHIAGKFSDLDKDTQTYWDDVAAYIEKKSAEAAAIAQHNLELVDLAAARAKADSIISKNNLNPGIGKNFNDSSSGGYAAGGTNIPAGRYKVGERGWEYMDVPGGASIYSHERSMRMGNESYPVRSSRSVAPSSSGSVGSSSGGTTSGQTFILEVDGMELARIVNTSTDRYVKLKIGARGRAA